MNVYHFHGRGRQRGAIGVCHEFYQTVLADDGGAAEIALYEHWEHITRLVTVEPETFFDRYARSSSNEKM